MPIRTIKQIKNLAGSRVLVRVDFNVPLKGARVVDDSRLVASLPTLKYLIKEDAKLIIVTHLGRPEGKVVRSLRVDPVARRLGELLGKKIKKIDTVNWQLSQHTMTKLTRQLDAIEPGDVVMLENIRFSPHEQQDTEPLCRQLAAIADIFVLDGFAVAHRADASVAGVARILPSFAGLLMEKEITGLSKLTEEAKSPFVAIIGGAKIETKAPVIKRLLPIADKVLLGGGLVNTALKAMGYGIGQSLVDKEYLSEALKYAQQKKVLLPVDVVVGTMDGRHYRRVELLPQPHELCTATEAILDIGPATVRLYAQVIKKANTLLWNGAMGYFEQKPYGVGTRAVARLVASRSKGPAYGVVGGGETVQSLAMVHMSQYVDLVSTGGGAMLEFLAGKKLPGIEALKKGIRN